MNNKPQTLLPAARTISEAALRPNPDALWLSLWYEGEVCCLFSDSNLGKSIYAVQIATRIAETKKVLYFDFELSDKQFQLRYTDEQGNLNVFPRGSDRFVVQVAYQREGIKLVFFEDIYKLPENILCAKGRIEAICLQNGKLTRGELFETIFINKVEKKQE